MNQGDPTDNALAAIASILDQHSEPRREPERPAAQPQSTAVPPPLPDLDEEPAPVEIEAAVEPDTVAEIEAPSETHFPTEIHAPIEAHGYSRLGPGPMAAIRFKWTVRLDNGEYFVDETIGQNSNPVVIGPLTREAAVQMVHDREAAAQRSFEQLKSEMSGRSAVANLVRKDSGEA